MTCRVRTRREQLGMTQKELAAKAEISRQTLHAIEMDRQSPSVELALRLARVLTTHVEALFAEADPPRPAPIEAALAGRLRGQVTRVLACELRGRYVAHSLAGQRTGAGPAADGVARVVPGLRRGRVRVELAASLEQVHDNLVIAGSVPGLALLCDHLNRAPGPGRFRLLPRERRAALTALAKSQVHVAGAAIEASPSASSRAFARYLPSASALVIALASWDVGLVLSPQARARQRARGSARHALADPRLRLALQEPGSAAREQCLALLADVGADPRDATASALAVQGYTGAARAVALGLADVGLCIASAAREYGLAFEPCMQECFGLIVPDDIRDHRIARMHETLASAAWQRDLRALGYDARLSGKEWVRIQLD